MKHNIIIRLIPLGTFLLFLGQVMVSNHLSGSGLEVRKLELEISRLQEENQQLEHTLAAKSSLFAIAGKAAEYGFIMPTKYQNINSDQYPVALRSLQ